MHSDKKSSSQDLSSSFSSSLSSSDASACVFDIKENFTVATMDFLVYSDNVNDCQIKCEQIGAFNCKSFHWKNHQCALSGDERPIDGGSEDKSPLLEGAQFGQKSCSFDTCSGLSSYELVRSSSLSSGSTLPVKLNSANNSGSSFSLLDCKEKCDKASLKCPSFLINYQTGECTKSDHSQGRYDFEPLKDSFYLEKTCLKVSDEKAFPCRSVMWAFERVLGHQLELRYYQKNYTACNSRRDCEQLCLEEDNFQCKSALYDETDATCRLSADTMISASSAYVRNKNPKASYLENNCISFESEKCPFVEQKAGRAVAFATQVVKTQSLAECGLACEQSVKFRCTLYAYREDIGECTLSFEHSKRMTSNAASSSNYVIYERRCTEKEDNATDNVTDVPDVPEGRLLHASNYF